MFFKLFYLFILINKVSSSSYEKLTNIGSLTVSNDRFSTRSSNLDNLIHHKSPFVKPVVNFKTSSSVKPNLDDFTVLRFNNSDGTPSRTIILPKINAPVKEITPRLPVDAFGRVRPVKYFNKNGVNRTVFNPPVKYEEKSNSDDSDEPFFDEPDNNFVLISDSSHPVTTDLPDFTTYETVPYPSTAPSVSSKTSSNFDGAQHRRYKIKRRKYRKNSTTLIPSRINQSSATSLKNSYATEKDAKFLNLFTIIQFPNDACSEEGGTCYHELECTGLGGIPTTRCARGYGVCCMIEATCGARTNINNTVFVGSETTMGSCSLSIDKVPCTKQIRLDFLQFELEPPMDGECVKDRLFISGANKDVMVPVLCGSLTGQHIYLDVDDVPGPVVLNLISTRPLFRIKISQVCDGNPMLAPKSCLQYYRGRQGVIRSFNYVPGSMVSSYLNNLNYAICVAKEPDSCSITYSNETPEGMEFEFDIVNLDADGSLSVPPRQAGAEVFNCPDDYIAISNVRLCGQKLNDGSVQVDFTRNYPVTDTTRGPYAISVRSDESNVGRGFYLTYEQKPCTS